MSDQKPEEPTAILEWKPSLQKLTDNSVNKLIKRLIENNMIKLEKDLTMNFVKGQNVEKYILLTYYDFLIVMENKRSRIPKFDLIN